MANQDSAEFLLPAVAYVPLPTVTGVSVATCTDFHPNLVVGLCDLGLHAPYWTL